MLRQLIAKFNRSMAERVASIRYQRAVPIKLSFEPNSKTERLDAPPQIVYVMGETTDLSHTGIAFVVSAIRIKENYLVGEGRTLDAELDLPNGKVLMKIIGQRYEPVGEHISTARYLVGASIKEMTEENREAYDDFLRLSGAKGNAGSLKFRVDER